jgi:anti-sigma regulatory factor (Ser/Thr protein kinase)
MEGLAVVPVTEPSQPPEARRVAIRMADGLRFSEIAQGNLALVVTEAATNLIRHAKGGRIFLLPRHRPASIEVLAVDSGPGMVNVTDCLRDGFSTAGGSGTGLGAMKRLAAEFDVYSIPGQGTVVRAVCPAGRSSDPAPAWDVSVIGLPKRGEQVSGDATAYRETDNGICVMVADGLGHGVLAAEASRAAREAFLRAQCGPVQAAGAVHEALRSTRGAAIGIAEIDASAGRVGFCGVGNIAAVIVNGERTQHLVSMNGIAGMHSPRLRLFDYAWPHEGVLILHSDGLSGRWQPSRFPHLFQRSASTTAAALFRDLGKETDDATVLVVKGR